MVHWRRDGKPLQYSCLENPMNSMKMQNDRILKEELPRSEGAQYATGDQWRNNSKRMKGEKEKHMTDTCYSSHSYPEIAHSISVQIPLLLSQTL